MLVLVVVVGYLYATAERRRPVEIAAATAVERILLLEVDSCGGEPAVTELDESEDGVRIVVEATTRPLGATDECLDSVEARLTSPLRHRVLVDGSSGQTVEVQRSD